MHLNIWKSTLVCWANALGVAPPVDFVEDLKAEFFVKLLSFLSDGEVQGTLDDTISYIKRFYPLLVIGVELDENDTTLLATSFLILTSIHQTNANLCARGCRLPYREQEIVKQALEAFVGSSPAKITKEVVFGTLAQLPEDDPEDACKKDVTPKGATYCSGTPGTSGSGPGSRRRSSCRFQRLQRQLRSVHDVKQDLQNDLEQARDTISQLEEIIEGNKHEIAHLKNRLARAKKDRSNPCSPLPVPEKKECFKCKTLEKQVASLEGLSGENELEILGLKETLDALKGKITNLESEKKFQSSHLDEYEEQFSRMDRTVAILEKQKQDLLSEKKELEDIIVELREARAPANMSLEAVVPDNLANEVVDIQLVELKAELEAKTSALSREKEELGKCCGKLALKEQEVISMENELLDLSSELDQVTSQCESLQNDLFRAESLLACKEDEINKVREELVQCRSEMAEYERKTKIGKSVINSLKADIEKLAREKQQTEATALERLNEISSYELRVKRLEDAMKDFKALERQRDELKEELAGKERIISSLQLKTDQLQDNLHAEQDHKQTLQEEISALQASVADKTLEVSNLKEVVVRCEKAKEELSAQCGHLDVIQRKTTERLVISLKKVTDLEQLLDKDREQLRVVHGRCEKLQKELELKEQQSEDMKSTLRNVEAALLGQQQKCELRERDKSELEVKVKGLTDELSKKQELVKGCEADKLRLGEQMAALVEELKKLKLLEAEKSEVDVKVGMLMEEVGIKQKALDDSEIAKSRLLEEVAILQRQNIQTKKSLEESNNKLELVQAEKASLHKQLGDCSAQMSKYAEDMKILTSTLKQESVRASSLESDLVQLQVYKSRCEELGEELAEQKNLAETLRSERINVEAALLEESKKLKLLGWEKSDLDVKVGMLMEEIRTKQEALDDSEVAKSRLEEEKQEFEVLCQKLEEELTEQKSLAAVLRGKVSNVEAALQEETRMNEVLKKENSGLQAKVQEMLAQITEANETIDKHKKIENEFESEIADSHAQLDLKTGMLEETTGQLKATMLENVKLRKEYAHLDASASTYLTDVQALKSQLDIELQRRCSVQEKLEALISEKETTAALNSSKIEALERELEGLRGYQRQCDELMESISVDRNKMSALEVELKTAATSSLESDVVRLHEIEGRCQKLEEELTEQKNLAEALRGKVSNVEAALQEETRMNEMLEKERSGLHTTIQEMTSQITKANETIDSYKKAEHAFELEIADSRAQLDLKTGMLEETTIQLRTLKSQLDTEQQRCCSIQEELEALISENKTIAALNSTNIEVLERELEELRRYQSQCNELVEAISADRHKMAALKEELKTASTSLEGEVQRNRSLEKKITSLEDQLQEKEVELSSASEKLAKVHSAYESLDKEADNRLARIESLNADINRLTQEKELMSSQSNPLLVEIENITRRLEFTSMELDVKNETILMMEATLNSYAAKISLLESRVAEKDDTVARLERECEAARETSRSLVEKDAIIAELQAENKAKCASITKMAEELVQVSQTFNIEKTSLLDHTNNLEELLVRSSDTEKILQTQIEALRKEREAKTELIGQLEEKLSVIKDKLTIERRDLTAKCESLKAERDDLSEKYDRAMKQLEGLSAVEGQMGERLSQLTEENKELSEKLSLKVKDIDRYCQELGILQKSLKSTQSVNQQLEREVKALTVTKQQEIARLEKEKADLIEKTKKLKPHVDEMNQKIREEYEVKLGRLKEKMIATYTRKLHDYADENASLKDELSHEKSKRFAMEARIQELSDQLIIIQEEKRALMTTRHEANVFRQPYALSGAMVNPAYDSPPMHKAQSLDRLPTLCRGLDNFGADFSMDQSGSNSRRTSTSSNRSSHLPKGIGKVFPAAEEEGEVFDNRYLADLKSGNCPVSSNGPDRVSILQLRNSMCPPHLKSSYPVESQFFSPGNKEDEIKTPSKSNKENQPRDSQRKVMGTPSKLKALFTGRR